MIAELILGLITGLSYGLLAVGIVLIFKANRFLNLAHAQLGTLSALLLGRFVLENGWSWWLAFPVVVAVGVATGLLIERLVVRPMLRQRRPPAALLLVSIGVAQLLLAVTYVQGLGPSSTSLFRKGYPVPFQAKVDLGTFVLRGEHILVLVLVPLVVACLALFLRFSIWGKTIRAAASNNEAAQLCGIPVRRVSALAWGIAGGLSAITAVLQAPGQDTFNAASLGPGLLLRALGAAALGGFTSIPAALVGGIALGEIEHLTLSFTHNSGSGDLAVFISVLAVLFLRGGRIAAAGIAGSSQGDDTPTPLRVPHSIRNRPLVRHSSALLAGTALVTALALPLLPGLGSEARRFQLVIVLVMAIAGVALTMLVGWAGQVSLGHFALLGLGAYLAARLETHDFSLLAVLATAAIIGAATTAVIGIPALRLRGLTLALTTLGFAVVAPVWLFQQPWLGSEGRNAVVVHPAAIGGVGRIDTQIRIYYTALTLLVLVLLAGSRLRRTMPGRLVLAVRDNEKAVSSFGVMPASVKLTILALSGAVVTMAGVLWGTAWQTMSVDLVPPEASLVLLAIPVIGGLGSLSGAVSGAVFIYVPAFFRART